MQKITESDNEHQKWYEEAKSQTIETLPIFLKHLTEDYSHDYGTICHAITAGAIATSWAMNKTPQGGITGFQASCIMWEFIKNWMSYKGALRLIKYEDMLYPQYAFKFNTINKETWKFLQDEAKNKLEETRISNNVRKHLEEIVNGVVPFGYSVE